MEKKREFWVILAFCVVSVVWGSTYIGIRIGVEDLPPELFMGTRFVVAGSIVLLFSRLRGMTFPNRRDAGRYAVVGLFQISAAIGIIVYVEQWVHSGITSMIIASMPIFMALFEFFLPNRRRIEWKGWIGLVVGFGGVAILILTGSEAGSIDFLGAVLLILAAAFWAGGSVYSKSFPGSGSIVPRAGIQMLAGGAVQCIAGLIMGEAPKFHFTSSSFWAFIYLLVVGSFVGYGAFVYVMHHWPASKAGTYAYINPVVAVFLGVLILNEPLTLLMGVSAAITLGGVFLVQLSRYRSRDFNAGI